MTTTPAPQRHKVLIVDDDPGMVHLLARTLLDFAQLHFAVRGDDALAKLAQHKPDLLVIDAELPDLDGYSVIARLRENPQLAHTAVVMVTSHNDASHRQRAFAAGVLDFFTKPIDRDLIRLRVQQILNGETMELIELDDRPLPVRKAAAAAAPVVPPAPVRPAPAPMVEAAPPAAGPVDVNAVTSELFERMSAILSQAETLRERVRPGAPASEIYPIQRIQEECAEVIQLLVTISGED
ncbi:MAG: response regulator [Hydrogenophaga sp.]|nr:response regulator [Hydrogenophaga sp.]